MLVKNPVVNEKALLAFRAAQIHGVLGGLSSVTLRNLRHGPMCLYRRGWRLLAPDNLSPSEARRYCVGAPPELGQILTIDLATSRVQLDTYAGSRVQRLRASLAAAWRAPSQDRFFS